ncbi:MAG TPA: hypothetical protein VFZ24_02385 [Longimicrobiales bacterium]
MSPRDPALWRALLARESGRALTAPLALAAIAAVGYARRAAHAAAVDAAAPPMRLRFDSIVLLLVTVVLVLRIATRAEADRASGWVEPVVAAGGSRLRYGLAITASVWCSSALVFMAAAATFALALPVFGASVEPLRTLLRTIGGGILLLAVYAVHAGCIGVLLRRSVPAIVVAGTIVVAPYALMTRALLRGDRIEWWLLALTHVVPPVALPSAADVLPLLGQVGAGTALLAWISHHFAARRT